MTSTGNCDLERMRFEFFAWAAARAAQAGSSKTSVLVLRKALFDARASRWDAAGTADSPQDYDAWHLQTIDSVHRQLTETVPTIGWGIAAKLVNVYIKGNWLLDDRCSSAMRSFGHPAIDSILLQLIDHAYQTTFSKHLRWQRMTRVQYEEVIALLRTRHPHQAIWTIEEQWRATRHQADSP